MSTAEDYVDTGTALVQLGRWLQRHFPRPDNIGSQYEEDKVLADLLPGPGVYVDVGASHPMECSNTWKLYERGWRGLLIEPLPECWPGLLLHRREDRLCPMAASNAAGFASLRVCRTVSSLRPDWPIGDAETIPVQTDTLKNILAGYRDHDWSKARLCSIDVEGHEREVLEGIDWATFRPEVFVIEHLDYNPDGPGRDVSDTWRWILEGNGYHMHCETGINQIWTRL